MAKLLAIVVLIGLGIFLYMRAQRLAKEELEQSEQNRDADFDAKLEEDMPSPQASGKQQAQESDADIRTEADSKEEPEADSVNELKTATHQEPALDSAPLAEVQSKPEPEPEPEPEQEQEQETDAEGLEDMPAMPLPVPAAISTEDVTLYLNKANSAAGYGLLLGLMNQCYKQRKQADMLSWGAKLLPRFSEEVAQLKQASASTLTGAGHMQMSTLLADSGLFDEAIAVCEQAQALGLEDGTVTGFAGRITRIERARKKAAE